LSTEYRTCCLFCCSDVQALADPFSNVSFFILLFCILSCAYFLLLSAYFCPYMLHSFLPCLLCPFIAFFTPSFVCYTLDLCFSCFVYFIHPPSQSLLSFCFSFIYLIFFHHLIVIGVFSLFVSSLSFEVFLPISLFFFHHSFFSSTFLYHFHSPPTSLCLVQFIAVPEMLLLACLM
jgi:hypothetical protein